MRRLHTPEGPEGVHGLGLELRLQRRQPVRQLGVLRLQGVNLLLEPETISCNKANKKPGDQLYGFKLKLAGIVKKAYQQKLKTKLKIPHSTHPKSFRSSAQPLDRIV